jgi:tetrahydromethanopterin S-methyltransferase subunit G
MNYVSTVVGKLVFDDINLELDYMEIISLSPGDFKASPRIREAFQNRQLVIYDPRIHVNAKKFNRYSSDIRIPSFQEKITVKENPKSEVKFSEINDLKNILNNISVKMENLVGRVSQLIDNSTANVNNINLKIDELIKKDGSKDISSVEEKFQFLMDLNFEHHSKIEELLQKKEEKFNNIISRLDDIISKGISVGGSGYVNHSIKSSKSDFDDTVTFVPEIDVSNVKTSIKSESITQEGTDDVLEKLRALKANK